MAPMATALITGGTAGLGRGFAEALAQEGHDLVLVARNEVRLRETADELYQQYGVAVEVLPADLVDRQQRAGVEERLRDRALPVDLVVNNAGIGLKQHFVGGDLDAEQMMLDLLVTAPMRLTHAAVGGMVERCRGYIITSVRWPASSAPAATPRPRRISRCSPRRCPRSRTAPA